MGAHGLKRLFRSALLMGTLVCALPAQALFYDPFMDADSIKPSDELEDRIWQESDGVRAQFIHDEASGPVLLLQNAARNLMSQKWPQLASHLQVHVIDNADVLALSSANGDIILSTGMLMRLDTTDELQVILAREMAHVINRHAVRTVYAARLGAGASMLFQTVVKANSFVGTVGLLSSFQVSPEMLIADGGKAFVQSQFNKLKDNMADNFVRRMSATGFDAMVKTSLFGYSESLESEADDYALKYMAEAGISPDTFHRVMQRLMAEADLDERKFSAFYANAERMHTRVQRGQVAVNLAPHTQLTDTPAAVAQAAAPPDLPPVTLALGAVELAASDVVASVVLEGDTLIKSYGALLNDVALASFESELDAGHINRAIHSIERQRLGITLPDQHRVLLAQACWAHPDPYQQGRAEAIALAYLQQSPKDHKALKLLGLIALKHGQTQLARTYLEQAAQFAPTEDERGFIEQHLRRTDKKVSAL